VPYKPSISTTDRAYHLPVRARPPAPLCAQRAGRQTGKRKRYPETLKARVALEAIKGIKSMSELSAEYRWRDGV